MMVTWFVKGVKFKDFVTAHFKDILAHKTVPTINGFVLL